MALDAGCMSMTVEFDQGLKDMDWFGRQDPYCIVRCGAQTFRTRTAVDGGKNPVWGETFTFNVINENSIEIQIMDEDSLSRDDLIGTASISLAKAREQRSDHIQAPIVSKRSKKQHGFVSVRLSFAPNSGLKPASALPAPPLAPQQQPCYALPQQWAAPDYYAAPAPMYAQPYHMPPAPSAYPSAYPSYHAGAAYHTACPPVAAYHYPLEEPTRGAHAACLGLVRCRWRELER